MDDIRELLECDGKSLEVVKLINDKVLCWDRSAKVKSSWTGMTGWNDEAMILVKLEAIPLDILKTSKLYNFLSPEIKDKMEHLVRAKKDELMAKARASRKSKYENIPKELICSKCSKTVEAIPSKIASICDKKNILLVDYLSSFLCKNCNPVKRGKPSNPLYAHLPKTMKCECGREVMANFIQLKTKAEKLGVTIEELIKGYKCQKCEKKVLTT